jgi:hypothetical protein
MGTPNRSHLVLRQGTVSFELFDRQSRDAMTKADDSLVLQVGRKSWQCKEVDVSVMSASPAPTARAAMRDVSVPAFQTSRRSPSEVV